MRAFAAVSAALFLISFLFFERIALPQMASAGASDQPARPLPSGIKPPRADFRDLVALAGLTAKVISGERDQNYLVENSVTGIAMFNFDNDAYLELFIGQYGYDVLLRNQGNDRFRDETRERGLYRTELRWSTGCAFIDHDRDGFLDLVLPTTSTQRRRPPASPPAEWL